MSTTLQTAVAVMMAVTETVLRTEVTEGTDKSGVIVQRISRKRGAWYQKDGESLLEFENRKRAIREKNAIRMRAKRAARDTEVHARAVDILADQNIVALPGSVCGVNRATQDARDVAVVSAVASVLGADHIQGRTAETLIERYTTNYRRGFSSPQYRTSHYGNQYTRYQDAPFCAWPRYQGIDTQDGAVIRKQLDTHFARVANRRTYRTARYTLSGTRAEVMARNEAAYRSMNAAQRSKSDPFMNVQTAPVVDTLLHFFAPDSAPVLTATERLDRTHVTTRAGASVRTVERHAPTQGTDKDGKPLPFTYGGSVPQIPSDMPGLICARGAAGVYGSGQSNLLYRPFRFDRKGRRVSDFNGAPNRSMDTTYRKDEHTRVMREYAPDLAVVRPKDTDGRRGTSLTTPTRGQFAQFSISHLTPNC